jgi:hypothetical protein
MGKPTASPAGDKASRLRRDSAFHAEYTAPMRGRIAMVLLAGLLAGCDSGGLPGFAGMTCRETSDCNSGLQCLEYSTPVDGGCASQGTLCVQPCLTSADCTSQGAGFACYAACGGQAICQPAYPGMQDGGAD